MDLVNESYRKMMAQDERRRQRLRQHYAGLAMQGLIAARSKGTYRDCADEAVMYADALITALSPGGRSE